MSDAALLRPLAAADLATASAICAAACQLDPDGEVLLAGLLRAPRQATVAVMDGAVVGVCVTSTGIAAGAPQRGASAPGRTGFVDLLAVEPARQGAGLGSRLVAHAERALVDAGCDRVHLEGNAPFYAWPGVDVRYIRAIALSEGRGYRRLGVEISMSVDLLSPPLASATVEQRLTADDVDVRYARDDERDALMDWLATGWKDSWLLELDAAFAAPGAGVVIAKHGDFYVGFCGFGANRPGEVGPLGVDPQWRGHGIGTVLIRGALRAIADRGHRTGQVPWAGPVALFARTLEATVTRVFVRYGKPLP